jgi:hypothetical protein
MEIESQSKVLPKVSISCSSKKKAIHNDNNDNVSDDISMSQLNH